MGANSDYRPARREAIVAAIIWFVALVVTISVSFALGYGEGVAESVFGIPKWIVFGVFTPWIIFFGVHLWYSLYFCGSES